MKNNQGEQRLLKTKRLNLKIEIENQKGAMNMSYDFESKRAWQAVKEYTLWATIMNLIILIVCCASCYAGSINREEAIRAIIGESSNQGYEGMLAVACGIRNRGSLDGVHGLRAPHVDNEPRWVWEQATKAWDESESNRVHSGDCWGSKVVDKVWLERMEYSDRFERVYEYREHVFYRERG